MTIARQFRLFSSETPTARPDGLTPRRQRAFTLHETLVTLVAVGILAATAVPALKRLVSGQRMHTAINGLVTALHSARSEAIKRGERAVLCPSADGLQCQGAGADGTWWHTGYLLYVDHNANHERDGDEPVVHVFDATPGLRIHTSASRPYISYLPSGLAYGTNARFTFCADHDDSPPRSVALANSGRPRVVPTGDSTACPATSA